MKLLLIVVLLLPSAAVAQTVVYPTGDPAQDVAAVRTAVRAGGAVLLKATDAAGEPRAFDFGDFPVGAIDWNEAGSGWVALGTAGDVAAVAIGGFTVYVSVGNDVRLVGETVGGAMTTIRGGTIPIRNFERRHVAGVGERVVYGLSSLAVEGIRFTESALQSIYTTQLGWSAEVRAFAESRSLDVAIDIQGNEFIDVQPAYSFFWYALAAVTDGPVGAARVRDNRVRFAAGRWDVEERAYEARHELPRSAELWEGFSIADLHAPGHIVGNLVQGVDVGLLVYFEGSDAVHIAENHVELRPDGFVGIACQANHTYLVERNTVIGAGASPDGIVIWAADQAAGINGSTVRHNRVVLDGSEFGGISIVGAGASNHVADNRVEGSAAYALGLVADFFEPDRAATDNAFIGNQISRFEPRDSQIYGPGADVLFDAHSRANVLVGRSGTVRDLGQGNFITGVRPTGSTGPGATLSEALAAKRDLLRRVRP